MTKRIRFGALVLAMMFGGVLSQASLESSERLIKQGLLAEDRGEPWVALELFSEAADLRPNDGFLQQKIAQQLSDATFLESSAEERLRLAKEALPYARRAVELDPQSPKAHLSMAVLYGKLAVEGSVGKRIEYARQIREYAETALALDPQYAWGHHVLGKWHVELSQLGTTKRAFVQLFFGGLPNASLEEGIAALEEAVRLEPEALSHWVELGFAYEQAGRREEAVSAWEKAQSLPEAKVYDGPARERAANALERLKQSGK